VVRAHPAHEPQHREQRVRPLTDLDGLKLYFTSNRTVNFELFYATRSAPYQQFGPPTQIMELADPGTDAGPCVRIDDCEILREPALLDARARARAHE